MLLSFTILARSMVLAAKDFADIPRILIRQLKQRPASMPRKEISTSNTRKPTVHGITRRMGKDRPDPTSASVGWQEEERYRFQAKTSRTELDRASGTCEETWQSMHDIIVLRFDRCWSVTRFRHSGTSVRLTGLRVEFGCQQEERGGCVSRMRGDFIRCFRKTLTHVCG